MWHVWETGEVSSFSGETLMERGNLEDLSVDGRIILKCSLRTWSGVAWTGLIWLEIGTSGRLL
jgi:hypothetical protein